MSWVEDAVTFRGYVRRSGNSLVVTIPSELSQRFLIREGQEFIIFGVSRRNPDFEGALQIYLGYFTVYEKAPTLKLRLSKPPEESVVGIIREVARKYGATKVLLVEDGVKIVFGAIEDNMVKRTRKVEEVKQIMGDLVKELEENGVKVEESNLSEEIFEWRNIDPSVVSKSPSKLGESIRYKWEL